MTATDFVDKIDLFYSRTVTRAGIREVGTEGGSKGGRERGGWREGGGRGEGNLLEEVVEMEKEEGNALVVERSEGQHSPQLHCAKHTEPLSDYNIVNFNTISQ